MLAILICLGMTVIALMSGWSLFVIGMRDGDRLGDAVVGFAEPTDGGRMISFAVHNPAPMPVLIGASVRRRTLRLRVETGLGVSAPRRTAPDALPAGRHSVVWAIPAGETHTVRVPFSPSIRRRAELVVVVGEPDRLRVVRQRVHRAPAHPIHPVAASLGGKRLAARYRSRTWLPGATCSPPRVGRSDARTHGC